MSERKPSQPVDLIGEMPEEDRLRISALLRGIGGSSVQWGAQNLLEVWLVEHRMEAERKSSDRITRATWALAIVTCVLALATVGLIIATLRLS